MSDPDSLNNTFYYSLSSSSQEDSDSEITFPAFDKAVLVGFQSLPFYESDLDPCFNSLLYDQDRLLTLQQLPYYTDFDNSPQENHRNRENRLAILDSYYSRRRFHSYSELASHHQNNCITYETTELETTTAFCEAIYFSAAYLISNTLVRTLEFALEQYLAIMAQAPPANVPVPPPVPPIPGQAPAPALVAPVAPAPAPGQPAPVGPNVPPGPIAPNVPPAPVAPVAPAAPVAPVAPAAPVPALAPAPAAPGIPAVPIAPAAPDGGAHARNPYLSKISFQSFDASDNSNARAMLENLRIYREQGNFDDANFRLLASSLMEGQAKSWWLTLAENIRLHGTAEEILEAFEQKFCNERDHFNIEALMLARKFQPSIESFDSFYSQMANWASQAKMSNARFVAMLRNAQPEALKSALALVDITDPDSLARKVKAWLISTPSHALVTNQAMLTNMQYAQQMQTVPQTPQAPQAVAHQAPSVPQTSQVTKEDISALSSQVENITLQVNEVRSMTENMNRYSASNDRGYSPTYRYVPRGGFRRNFRGGYRGNYRNNNRFNNYSRPERYQYRFQPNRGPFTPNRFYNDRGNRWNDRQNQWNQNRRGNDNRNRQNRNDRNDRQNRNDRNVVRNDQGDRNNDRGRSPTPN